MPLPNKSLNRINRLYNNKKVVTCALFFEMFIMLVVALPYLSLCININGCIFAGSHPVACSDHHGEAAEDS